jgi:hypothetical protein
MAPGKAAGRNELPRVIDSGKIEDETETGVLLD